MLQKLAEQVAECHRRAREAARKAALAADPATRQDYLDLERRWLFLAESYQFAQRVEDFQGDVKKRITVLTPPAPPDPALPRVTCPNCGRKMKLLRIEPAPEPRRADKNAFGCACGQTLELTFDRTD